MNMHIRNEKTGCMGILGVAVPGHILQCAELSFQAVICVKQRGVFSSTTGFRPTSDALHQKVCAARVVLVQQQSRVEYNPNIWL